MKSIEFSTTVAIAAVTGSPVVRACLEQPARASSPDLGLPKREREVGREREASRIVFGEGSPSLAGRASEPR